MEPVCVMQSSVWGSGIAGAACAVLALFTGDFNTWQVGRGCGMDFLQRGRGLYTDCEAGVFNGVVAFA